MPKQHPHSSQISGASSLIIQWEENKSHADIVSIEKISPPGDYFSICHIRPGLPARVIGSIGVLLNYCGSRKISIECFFLLQLFVNADNCFFSIRINYAVRSHEVNSDQDNTKYQNCP